MSIESDAVQCSERAVSFRGAAPVRTLRYVTLQLTNEQIRKRIMVSSILPNYCIEKRRK